MLAVEIEEKDNLILNLTQRLEACEAHPPSSPPSRPPSPPSPPRMIELNFTLVYDGNVTGLGDVPTTTRIALVVCLSATMAMAGESSEDEAPGLDDVRVYQDGADVVAQIDAPAIWPHLLQMLVGCRETVARAIGDVAISPGSWHARSVDVMPPSPPPAPPPDLLDEMGSGGWPPPSAPGCSSNAGMSMTLTSDVAAGALTLLVMMRDCGLEGGMQLVVAPGMSNEEVVTLSDDEDRTDRRRRLTSVTIMEYALVLSTSLRFSHGTGELVRVYEDLSPPPASSPTPPPFPPPLECACGEAQPTAPPQEPPSAPPLPEAPPLVSMSEEDSLTSDALTSEDGAGIALWTVGGAAVIILLLLCCIFLLLFALPRYLKRRKEAKQKKKRAPDPFPAAPLAPPAPAPLPAPEPMPAPTPAVLQRRLSGGWDGKLWQYGEEASASPAAPALERVALETSNISLHISPALSSTASNSQVSPSRRAGVPLHPGWGAKGSWTGASEQVLSQTIAASPLPPSYDGSNAVGGTAPAPWAPSQPLADSRRSKRTPVSV